MFCVTVSVGLPALAFSLTNSFSFNLSVSSFADWPPSITWKWDFLEVLDIQMISQIGSCQSHSRKENSSPLSLWGPENIKTITRAVDKLDKDKERDRKKEKEREKETERERQIFLCVDIQHDVAVIFRNLKQLNFFSHTNDLDYITYHGRRNLLGDTWAKTLGPYWTSFAFHFSTQHTAPPHQKNGFIGHSSKVDVFKDLS